ncbi:MAG: septum formation inhibitor Maf [Nitrospirae bacterium]|nr:septum formation inhibitor Maf [Nitrospirota bacterium]
MPDRRLILASGSPRRKELLELAGLKFRVVTSDYIEDMTLPMKPGKLAEFLSGQKADSVAAGHPDVIVIAADTFIEFEGTILGKPHTNREAKRMLKRLSGRRHEVITGYTIVDTATNHRISRSVTTKVWFRDLSDGEIDAYVKSGEPLDKAGAYAIQGLGALLVEKISGDYFNVIGLPLSSVAQDLKKFGVTVLK